MVEAAKMLALALTTVFQTIKPVPVYVTYYGTESDGYLGQHHGSYWHGDSCGLPDIVDNEGYGVAAPRWIPYCSRVIVCANAKCVVAVVVDRMKDDMKDGVARIDIWPAIAREFDIFGSAGVVIGEMYYYNIDYRN